MKIKQNVIQKLIITSRSIENQLSIDGLQLIADNSYQTSKSQNQITTQIKLLKEQQYIEPEQLKQLEENEKTESILNKRWFIYQICAVIRPEEPKKIAWDLIGMVFIFAQMITIPVILTFSIELTGGFGIFSRIMDYYFIADLVIQFQTGYFYKGNFVSSRKRIILNYLKLWFWLDLISSFPYDDVISLTITESNQYEIQRNAQIIKIMRIVRFVKIIRLMRALKLKKIINQLEDSLFLDRSITHLIQFLKICLIILCLSHWLACIWNAIRVVQDTEDNWYTQYVIKYHQELDNDPSNWFNQYVAGVYFRYNVFSYQEQSITTMITIGCGDISAQNPTERVFSVLVMILASGVFGYVMSSVVLLFQNTNESLEEILNKNDAAIIYMKQKKINKSLSSRIKNYLEWLAEDEQLQKSYAQNTLNKLSLPLKNQVTQLVHGKMMNQIQFLRKNFSSMLLKRLAFSFTEEIYNPEEWIINQTDPINESTSIYFILNGRVQICFPKAKGIVSLKELSKKEYFGEISFFGNVPRCASAKAQNFINLFRLTRRAFISEATQEDMEKFFTFKFFIEFEQNYQHLHVTCYLCKAKNHTAKNCPKSHYVINKYDRIEIIDKYNTAIKQQVNKRRLIKQKCNTFKWLRDPLNQSAIHQIGQDDYNFQKYMNSQKIIQVRKVFIKDSFNCDSVKEYTNFIPCQNLAQIAKFQNYNAEVYSENVRQLKAELKKNKLKSKFVQFLQSKNEKRQSSQKSHKFSDLIFDLAKKNKQQPQQQQLSVPPKLSQIQYQRSQRFSISPSLQGGQIGKDFRQNVRMETRLKRMPRKTYLGDLCKNKSMEIIEEDFEKITEDISESPVQQLKYSKVIKPNKSTLQNNESHLQLFSKPDACRQHKRSSSVNLNQKTSDDLEKYSKQFLENMIYLVINYKLQTQKEN